MHGPESLSNKGADVTLNAKRDDGGTNAGSKADRRCLDGSRIDKGSHLAALCWSRWRREKSGYTGFSPLLYLCADDHQDDTYELL